MIRKQDYKALLLEGIHSNAKLALENQGLSVQTLDQTPKSESDLIGQLKGISILGSRSRTKITKEILTKSDLLCMGAFCIGTNQIDLQTASKEAVAVFNAPYSNTRSVAEMVIGFVVTLSRNLFEASQSAHQGIWKKSAKGSFEVRGKTLGIIGYGHIGSQVSVLAESLGMKVIYYDIIMKLPIGNAKPTNSLKNLLKFSDFVTLHVPETSETLNLIDKKELQSMKQGARLINTSRGTVVNIDALKQSLDSHHLSGAALDVFPKEPKSNEDQFQSPLQNLQNVILTPHVGGSTEEAQESIGKEVTDNLNNFIFLGSTEGSVNFPQLNLPSISKQVRRISNIHKNQPGVLSQINNLVSQSGANIKNQYLSTNEFIGYLVMDVEKENVQDLCMKMSQLDSSLKTRILP